MSCTDKSYEVINKSEWMRKLENVHIQRTDMNKLIMNYLVTGTHFGSPLHRLDSSGRFITISI